MHREGLTNKECVVRMRDEQPGSIAKDPAALNGLVETKQKETLTFIPPTFRTPSGALLSRFAHAVIVMSSFHALLGGSRSTNEITGSPARLRGTISGQGSPQ